jgi:hypothetical protein
MSLLRHTAGLLRRPTTLTTLGAIALSGLAACADAPSAPAAASAESLAPSEAPQFALLSSAQTANVLTRSSALSYSVRVAQTIGSAGGTITVPSTGLTLVVPAGAVSAPTTFTISSPAGRGVWYDFGPSGAKFAVPLVIKQDLRGMALTGLDRRQFEGAYYVDGTRSETTRTAKVTEVLPVTFNATGTELTFKVTHFSGYMVSTGRTR